MIVKMCHVYYAVGEGREECAVCKWFRVCDLGTVTRGEIFIVTIHFCNNLDCPFFISEVLQIFKQCSKHEVKVTPQSWRSKKIQVLSTCSTCVLNILKAFEHFNNFR